MTDTENTDSISITPSSAREAEKPQVDIQALAERVFRLMKQDALIQKERQVFSDLNQRQARRDR
jgi:hypothetical protein